MAGHVVQPSHTAFMQGRNILDRVVVLHEAVHELHTKKMNGVILKLDFEKAYDKVKGFLFSCPQVVSCTQFSPAT
jgi:hypothetical protein